HIELGVVFKNCTNLEQACVNSRSRSPSTQEITQVLEASNVAWGVIDDLSSQTLRTGQMVGPSRLASYSGLPVIRSNPEASRKEFVPAKIVRQTELPCAS